MSARKAKRQPKAPLQQRVEGELQSVLVFLESHKKFLEVCIAALGNESQDAGAEVLEVLDTEAATRLGEAINDLETIVAEINARGERQREEAQQRAH